MQPTTAVLSHRARALALLGMVSLILLLTPPAGKPASARADGLPAEPAAAAQAARVLVPVARAVVARDGGPQAPAALEAPDPLTGDGRPMWVTGWYAGWHQDRLPPSAIDYSVVTHVMHFMIVPRGDGSLEVSGRPGFESPERIASLVNTVHQRGRKVLVSVGGAGSYEGFKAAIGAGSRARLVESLVGFVQAHGYDGVDVDMEPINPGDERDFQAFVIELRAALPPGTLLTVAAGPASAICPIEDSFDQVNIMTYDMSGPWEGWVTWHNAAVRSPGHFPSPHESRPLPSADGYAQAFIRAGCQPSKIGIGIDFYGYVWRGGTGTDTGGVTRPGQRWTSPPQVRGNVPYFDLAETYDLTTAAWDSAAEAAYVGIDRPGSENDEFVSFDNEQTVAAKVAYARQQGHGGIAIWELAGAYLRKAGAAVADPLVQALKRALGIGP
jgi:chitinase